MHIGDICTVDTITCPAGETVQGAALLMRHHHVGDVIVIDQRIDIRIPVGIVTDRDIVVSVIALGLDPSSLLVSDIMSTDLLTTRSSDDPAETIERMRARGIRRVPVLDAAGALAGIVSADDLLAYLADEMGELARISARQQAHEAHARQ